MDFDPNEDFEFGAELPDSDEEEVYAAEKEYDAANDETFGVEVEAIPDDLSSFAADALALKLEDTGLHNDQPSSSYQHPPNRPVDLLSQWSQFQNQSKNSSLFDSYQEQALKHQQEAVRATQSLWNDNAFRDAFNRAPSPPRTSVSNSNIRNMPGGALTLDEIEHQQLMQTGAVHMGKSFPLTPGDKRNLIVTSKASEVANIPKHSPIGQHSGGEWIHPPLGEINQHEPRISPPSKKTAITAEELERRLLDELQGKQSDTQSDASQTDQNMAAFFNLPPGMFPQDKMPSMTPMQIAQMQQLYQWQAMMAAMASGASVPPPNMVPPGFPPMIPPFGPPNPMFAAMMAQRMQMGTGVSGLTNMPPPGFHPSQKNQRPPTPNGRSYDSQGNTVSSPINRNVAPSGCESPSGSTTSRRTRKEGMPSLRTITDYACDPYAGFMSKKEREWLIKIQLIQCLGSGDKYADDYYYTVWKQNNTLEKRPESWKQPVIRSKYYNLDETYPSNYTPPSFSGVLGKPSSATTSFPRQALDFQPADDDIESIVGGPSREANKKKLRTILLTLENGYLLQLECEELLRKIPTVPLEDAGSLLNEICGKLDAIYQGTMDESHIPTTMVITKGRRLCIRILTIAQSALKAQIISNVFNTLRKYARKVSISPNTDFLHAAQKALMDIKDHDLKTFFDKTDAERFQDTLVYSSFSQNLTTALLIACAKREIRLDAFAPESTIVKFLQSERKMYNGLGSSYSELFAPEDLVILKNWLQTSTFCSSGNVAGCFLMSLREPSR